jgi:integrase/recombinase XerD
LVRFELPPPPPRILEKSNEEVLEAFLAALAAGGASPKTVKAYRAAIADFLAFIGDKPLRDVGDADVAAWIYRRLSEGVRRPRSPGDEFFKEQRERQVTMHYYTLFLRGFFEWLGLSVHVPVVKKPRGRSVEALSPAEIERLLNAVNDALDLLIVALLFETGLRAQEAVSLKLRDIDFARREIRVRNAKYGEERIVFYGALTEQALQIWLQLNPGLRPDDKLLGISYSGLYKRLKALAKRAGIDPRKVRPHVLRHTFATEALRRGVPLPVVQRLLGHRDIKVTQIYLHLVTDDVREAYQRAFGATPPMYQPYPPQPNYYPAYYAPPMPPTYQQYPQPLGQPYKASREQVQAMPPPNYMAPQQTGQQVAQPEPLQQAPPNTFSMAPLAALPQNPLVQAPAPRKKVKSETG